MSEEIKPTEKIKLTMKNKTNLDLIFSYNETEYPVKAKGIQTASVETGHYLSVHDPNQTKATRKKITVEPDYFPTLLDRNITINCELVGWQLQLRLGINI